eukprot:3868120-Pyramimonas_sp.AAC.1
MGLAGMLFSSRPQASAPAASEVGRATREAHCLAHGERRPNLICISCLSGQAARGGARKRGRTRNLRAGG